MESHAQLRVPRAKCQSLSIVHFDVQGVLAWQETGTDGSPALLFVSPQYLNQIELLVPWQLK